MAQTVENNISLESNEKMVSSIAMTVILVSFSMLFATLFLGYAAYRFTMPSWPPLGMERPDLGLPITSTLLVIGSSAFYWIFESQNELKKSSLWGAFIFGLGFLVSQMLLWSSLKEQGILLATGGIFSSIIYAFTWIHAAHMVAGVGLLAWLLFGFNKLRSEDNSVRINNVGKFWHFLSIVWLAMFVTVFVL